MKLITKETDYAIRALIALTGKDGEYTSVREISDRQGIPYQFLRRILQRLSSNGLVETKEGAQGGVILSKDPADIQVTEVINIFQGKVELSDCMFRKQLCSNRDTCPLRKELLRIEKMVAREFSGITIAGLAARIKEE